MIWNRDKLKVGSKIPIRYFSKKRICPICNTKINAEKEKFEKTGQVPYVRFFDKFYWIHKECFFVLYEGLDITAKENRDELMVDRL